jgi:pimeloyl-ACP methyl ester carboxylesterase
VIFVHGICDSPDSFLPLEQSVKSSVMQNGQGLYGSSNEWVVFYDGSNVWFQIPKTELNAGSADPPISPRKLKSIDPNARFFLVALDDPPQSDYRNFDPNLVADVPIASKGNELAHIIWAIKSITGAPRVILVTHSMGGLDSREYIENLADATFDNDIATLVTLDAPHGGAALAGLPSLPYTDWALCFANDSPDKEEMNPSSQVMQILNYQSGNASPLPPGLTITSIASYWTIPASGALTVWGTDDVLSSDEQDLKKNLDPNANAKSVLASVDNLFYSPFLTPASGLLECGVDDFLHLLPCVGDASQTNTNVENAVQPFIIMHGGQIQILPTAPSVSPGSSISLSAQISSGGPAIWSILEGAYGGTITQGGLYTAPPNNTGASETFHIVAINSQNSSQYGEIPVQVAASTEKATTTTVLSTTSPQVVEGMSVPLTATVQSGGGTPTGTITFYDGTNAISSPTAINGGGVATYTAKSLGLGFHSISALYSGDAFDSGSTSAPITITVTAEDPQLSVLPSTGTVNVTQFTKYDTGFAPNALITHTVTLPDKTQSVRQTYADDSGTSSYSVVYSVVGPYSEVDTDVASGNQTQPASWTVSSAAVNDFSLQLSPTGASVTQSGAVTVGLSTTTVGSTSQSLTLGVTNLPTGITATFAPTSITSGQTTALALSASSSAQPGSYTVTVVAASSTSNHSVSLSLTVTAAPTGPAVTLRPGLLQFNDQSVGSVSSPQTVLLMNSGSGQLIISSIALAAGSDFMLSQACGSIPLILNSLVPCDIQVSFAPTTTGARLGQIIVYDNAPDSPQTITLSGNGTATQPSTGTVNVNATLNGAPLPAGTNIFEYTLSGPSTYSGEAAYSFSVTPGTYSIAFTGVPSYLTLASVTPSSSQSVAAGGSVSFTLNFTAPNDFYPPEFLHANGGITPQVLTSGSTASYTVGLGVPPGNAAVPISLTVAGVPPGATASFNPNPANDNGDSALSIPTGTAPPGVYTLSLSGANSSGLTRADAVGGTSTLAITAVPSVPAARISLDNNSAQLSATSSMPSGATSSDGRYIVFATSAPSLTGSTNGTSQVFVRDLKMNTTAPVSAASNGDIANNASYPGGISADGRFAVFTSYGDNLPKPTSGDEGLYLRDLTQGTTVREDLASDGTAANGTAEGQPCISRDGRFIVFGSNATNLVSGTSGATELYEKDRETGNIALVSVAVDGTPANATVYDCAVSADGRFVVFTSASTNLVSANTNGLNQVFMRDTLNGTTSLISVSDSGTPANLAVDSNNTAPSVSNDGRYVVFGSNATNLVPQALDGNQDHLFQRDTIAGHTSQIDVDSVGTPLGGGSDYTEASQSADGRFVAFIGLEQTLVRDMVARKTQVISVANDGTPGNATTYNCCSPAEVIPGGTSVAFASTATNLVANDSNGVQDVFIAQNPFLGSPYLQSLTLSADTVIGGTDVTATVTLSAAAPAGGATVAVTTNNSTVAQVPAIVVVPSGGTSAQIDIPTTAVSAETPLTLTASYNGGASAAVLTAEPGAIMSVDPPASDFGYQAVGTGSSPEPITITNSGTATLTLNSVQLATGTSFSLSQNTCGSSVASGSSCSVSVAFKPAASGPASDVLQISYGSPASVQPISLTGTGSVPSATLNPSTLAFGTVAVFATATGSATLSNTGTATLSGVSATVSGQNAGDFSIASDGCTGVLLPPNTSCSVTVSFTPKGTGQRQGSLVVADNATGSPQTIALTGSATPITPAIAVTPSVSSVPTDQPFSVAISVNGNSNGVTPTGSVTLSSGSYTSAAAALSGGTVTIDIPAGQLAVGTDVLTASYTGDNNYNTATGTGSVTVTAPPSPLTPTVNLTPANNGAFDSSQSEAVTITVSGTGGTPTGTVTLSGSGYNSSATALSSGSVLITIPSNTFSASGSVTLTANYSGDSVYTTGSGTTNVTVNPPYKLTTSTPSSVNPGSPATATISLTADPSYSGTVALACALATSPTGASDLPTCSVTSGSPVTVTNGVASGTATVTINTTAATSASVGHGLTGWLGKGGTLLALLIFFGIPARRRNWRNLLSLLVMTVALASLSACGGGGGSGGGGGGGGGNAGTTAGTYTFTVTGTGTPSISPAPAVTVTLTVN